MKGGERLRTSETDVIYGADLIKYQRQADFQEGFADKLDPAGINIIVMTIFHRENEMRMEMLFKLRGREEPFEGSVTLPYSIAKMIIQRVKVGDPIVH